MSSEDQQVFYCWAKKKLLLNFTKRRSTLSDQMKHFNTLTAKTVHSAISSFPYHRPTPKRRSVIMCSVRKLLLFGSHKLLFLGGTECCWKGLSKVDPTTFFTQLLSQCHITRPTIDTYSALNTSQPTGQRPSCPWLAPSKARPSHPRWAEGPQRPTDKGSIHVVYRHRHFNTSYGLAMNSF